MSPEVVERKLALIAGYLRDLQPYEGASFEVFMQRHYEVERLLELLLIAASDIVFHLISGKKDEPVPSSYRAAFLRAGQAGMLSKELSGNLARAAGLRNILVHEYAEIDYALLHQSIPSAIRDFTAFIRELSR